MDFAPTEEQGALRDLAARIGAEIEGAEASWAALVEAEVVGLALPEADGGGGLGMIELALVLEALGRSATPVGPDLLDSLVLGAMPLARFGDARAKELALPGFLAGESLVTGAWEGLACVPLGARAATVVVDVGEEACLVVDPRWEAQVGTDDRPAGRLSFDPGRALRLGGPGDVHVDTRDGGALAGHALGRGTPDARGRAGDQDSPPFKSRHTTSSPSRARCSEAPPRLNSIRLAVRKCRWSG